MTNGTKTTQKPQAPAPADTNTLKDPHDWASGGDPMTGAQASYLKTLADQAHEPAPGDDLTKAEASERIGELKHELHLDGAHKRAARG